MVAAAGKRRKHKVGHMTVTYSRLGAMVFSVFIAGFNSGCGGDKVDDNSSDVGQSSTISSASSSSQGDVAGDCIEPANASGYCLVWADEFASTTLDPTKWSTEVNCWGGGNNEAQCYLDRPENLWSDGQYLHLKAIREDVRGPAVVDDDPGYSRDDMSGTGLFSSARIRSKNKGDWRYGRFEIRAKLPQGQGTWPAVWMLPTDNVYGGWAASGEIDIMEAVNLAVGGERRVHGTLHFGDNWPNNVYAGEEYLLPNGANPADDFHEYAVEWEEGEIRWYVDGDHFATQTQEGWYSMAALDESAAPFNQRFHLIMNLAVGGDWAANVNDMGIDEAAFPQEMVVDYVRVYQCTHDADMGRGCATRDDDFAAVPGVAPPTEVDTSQQEIVVFDGAVHDPYSWGVYSETGEVLYAQVDVGGEYGTVGEITFASDQAIGFYQSSATADFSRFQTLAFDLRVIDDSRQVKAPLILRADCVFPCSSGDRDIGYPDLGVWTHYEIPLQELASDGLDLQAINTPFVISSEWGNANGLKLQVDNIVIK